jgi:cytoskeletal protein RodZ
LSEIETHTVDPAATSPGAILKRCREYHDISLEEAEEATKIGANYLLALEEDQIGQFGNIAYLKGFLRIYATYLGLNPDDMIRLFDKLYTSGSSAGDGKTNGIATSDTPDKKKFPLQKLVMPAILLALILITAAIINRSPSTPRIPLQPAQPTSPIAVPAIQPALSSAKQAAPAKKTDEATSEAERLDSQPTAQVKKQPPVTENSKGFIVRMKVTQSGNLTVTIDGSTSQGYDLVVGDSIEWKADRNITLELSNAGGVEADLNGKPLRPFGPSGRPAVVVLDADGIKQ